MAVFQNYDPSFLKTEVAGIAAVFELRETYLDLQTAKMEVDPKIVNFHQFGQNSLERKDPFLRKINLV